MRLIAVILALFLASPSLAGNDIVGDSIAAGTAASPSTHSFGSLLNDELGFVDHGVSGAEIFDVSAQTAGVSVSPNDLKIIVEGRNSARWGCPAPCTGTASTAFLAEYRSSYEANLAWLALPSKHTARDGSVTYHGSCWSNTAVYGIGENSNCNGNSADLTPIAGNVLYFGMIQQDNAPGQCTFDIDGVSGVAVFNTQTTTNIGTTFNGASYGWATVRVVVGGLISATHTVTVRVTSPSSPGNRCYLDWYGGNYQPSGLSKVYASNVIYAANAAAYAGNGSSTTNDDAFSAQQAAAVAELAGDGLNVVVWNNRDVLGPSDMDGAVHPVKGHPKMFINFWCLQSPKPAVCQ
jgi:hypothetical protein